MCFYDFSTFSSFRLSSLLAIFFLDHLMAHPHASLMAAAVAQPAPFPGYNFHSSFHLYEYNQNNQNYLNQHRIDGEHNNGIDDSMWRPW